MKKYIYIFILLFSIDLYGESLPKICNAIWVISDQSRVFSCIKNGELQEQKFDKYVKDFANSGGDHIRILPYLNVGDDPNIEKYSGDMLYMPYVFFGGKYDLDQQNKLYFHNIRRMADICSKYKTTLIFSLFDRCHGTFKSSPHKNNWQDVDTWMLTCSYNYKFIVSVLESLSGANFKIEVCNEPFAEEFNIFFFWVVDILETHGVRKDQIIHGADFVANNFYWKSFLIDPLGPNWRVNSYTTIHQINSEILDYVSRFQATPISEGRKFFLSNDGLAKKPDRYEWFDLIYDFLINNPNAGSMGYIFEHTNAPYPSEEEFFDWAASMGISEAIKAVYGVYPENYGRYKKAKVLNDKEIKKSPLRNDL
jgi:hypothetical protein